MFRRVVSTRMRTHTHIHSCTKTRTHTDTHSLFWQTTLCLSLPLLDYTEIPVVWLLLLTLKLNMHSLCMNEWKHTHWQKHLKNTLTHMNSPTLLLYNDWTTGVYTTAALRKWLNSCVAQAVCTSLMHKCINTHSCAHTLHQKSSLKFACCRRT